MIAPPANQGARALVSAWRYSRANERADASAGKGGGDLIVMLLLARLCERHRGNESRDGKAGDQY
jgi:hypothetical protein